jgi:S1-C subfamily serine protease
MDYGNPTPPSGATPGSPVTPPVGAPVQEKKQKKGLKTGVKAFIGGLVGAALACVIVLAATGNLGNGGVTAGTVNLGSDTNTTINVKGEDNTLAETVAQKDISSVVCIYVYQKDSGTSSFFGGVSDGDSTETQSSLGSGVILSKDGYILTNYHVIDGASSLKVSVNGSTLDAKVVGTDESSDLAVIKVNATGLTPIEIGKSSDLKVGEWVMAIGSPYGMEQSVSTGIVSATNRSSASLQASDSTAVYTNMIQTDAAINPGNSGGALVDSDGKLIGINTMIASNSDTNSGVGFAIPVDYAMHIAEQLMKGQTPSHAQLGVSMATVDSQTAKRYGLKVDSGAYVNSVASGSGADKAGIQNGDILTKIGDAKITSATDAMVAVRSHNPGDKVTVEFNRNGESKSVEVTLGQDTDNSNSSNGSNGSDSSGK